MNGYKLSSKKIIFQKSFFLFAKANSLLTEIAKKNLKHIFSVSEISHKFEEEHRLELHRQNQDLRHISLQRSR